MRLQYEPHMLLVPDRPNFVCKQYVFSSLASPRISTSPSATQKRNTTPQPHCVQPAIPRPPHHPAPLRPGKTPHPHRHTPHTHRPPSPQLNPPPPSRPAPHRTTNASLHLRPNRPPPRPPPRPRPPPPFQPLQATSPGTQPYPAYPMPPTNKAPPTLSLPSRSPSPAFTPVSHCPPACPPALQPRILPSCTRAPLPRPAPSPPCCSCLHAPVDARASPAARGDFQPTPLSRRVLRRLPC